MPKKNYIIGKAEELTSLTPPPRIPPSSRGLYTIEESITRLVPQFEHVVEELKQYESSICPRDYVVTKLTLHPSYIAKGHFPKRLLREIGVHSIGSRATEVRPDRWTKKGQPKISPSTALYIAGKREQLKQFGQKLKDFTNETPGSDDLQKIWSIETIEPDSKVKPGLVEKPVEFEVGVQLIPGSSSDFIKASVLTYSRSIGFVPDEDISIMVSNLWFVPMMGSEQHLRQLAKHPFVRVVRPMPMLRAFQPMVRSMSVPSPVQLPSEPPLANDVRVAILDGGLPVSHPLHPWVRDYKLSDAQASDCEGGPEHGIGVSSAFLFGPIEPGKTPARPYSYIDHHRILDSYIDKEDPFELYRTLGHIEDILLSRQYEFINLSLGPDLAIDDDEVHAWTSLLDSYLADGETFFTVAAGNNGEADHATQLNRIQVPSDCVNAVAVGAADTLRPEWARAPYSAIGPGRAPGRVKPDLLGFGGSPKDYFHVLASSSQPRTVPVQGTSFASPYVLRNAVGIRAVMGHELSPLAIKALLVNSADSQGHDVSEVGWGKAPDNVEQLIESPDGVARILYQGELSPGKYLRVPLPIPDSGINGKVTIKATCCFSTPVDPQDSSMYTEAGVEISWIPKDGKLKESFFQQVKIATEAELRRDAAKWESVLHAQKSKFGNKLEKPAFELHYMARDGGGAIDGAKAPIIKYAFVVTLEAPKHKQLFTDILQSYADILTEIQPRVSIIPQVQI
ncbi:MULTISPECIES: S8 family peptidase [unclassified Photorhabdus]|uniref:S8 family peptidase n=1 Tax=unclassified Photorhabdus TaxID=2620880 RepID=UPI000DCCC719|nr:MULTISPECIES: S8 family peptidase [unclassified Photorhabdus]RAW97472.1 peptidase S8 and S53, subtilisin, kexin, sedolisin [Photorhabdus sp. S9-53]RAX00107.1 peptidase S8 and S53, subtilisin, kexin, sedolisin [Photorhabdus sp. S10-54]RAX04440.1 peptidase S8 and S53, subtilisin, kexin, sedolisin [Photorhabdus sp. S8-52]